MKEWCETEYLEAMLEKGEDAFIRLTDPCNPFSTKRRICQMFYNSIPIKAGKEIERIVKEVLQSYGATILPSRYNKKSDIDVHFIYNDKQGLIEIKIRDDHDSTKKDSIVKDYLRKKSLLKYIYNTLWFVVPNFYKNRVHYIENLGNEVRYAQEINDFFTSIISDHSEVDFYKEIMNKYNEWCAHYYDAGDFTFTHIIDLNNIKIGDLYFAFNYLSKQTVFDIFFAGQDYTQEIISRCNKKARKNTHEYKLREMLLNEK